MAKDRFEVKVRGGILAAEKLTDPDNPGIAVMYKPEGSDFWIDVFVVENQCAEIRHVSDESKGISDKDLEMYTFENVYTEEWQHRFEVLDEDIQEMLESVKEDE